MTMLVASSTRAAASDETPGYIAALASYAEDKLLGGNELARIIAACEQGSIANPFTPDEAELETNKWHAYETLQEWIGAGRLDALQVCAWAKKTRVEHEKQRREREKTREETTLPWEMNEPQYVAAGKGFTCVVQANGVPACKGKMDDGKVPLPNFVEPVKSIAASEHSICVIRSDDTVECWGSLQAVKTKDWGAVESITVNKYFICAIKPGKVLVCAGSYAGSYGGMMPPGLEKVVIVSAIGHSMCVIKIDGVVACKNAFDHEDMSVPKGLGIARSISTNYSAVCVITAQDRVQCWGSLASPPWAEHEGVRTLSVGAHRIGCAIMQKDASVRCWGGTLFLYKLPLELGPARTVAFGMEHVCAHLLNNTVRCWGGKNEHGERDVEELTVYGRSAVMQAPSRFGLGQISLSHFVGEGLIVAASWPVLQNRNAKRV